VSNQFQVVILVVVKVAAVKVVEKENLVIFVC
jgi:hypothetical protein